MERDIGMELDVLKIDFYETRDEVKAKFKVYEERLKCDDHNRRMVVLEGKLQYVMDEVKESSEKIETFMIRHESAQSATRWWFIGSVLVSLIVGSYFQERRFIDVNREVNMINARLERMSTLDSLRWSYFTMPEQKKGK